MLLTNVRSADREKPREKERQRGQTTFSEVEAIILLVICQRKRRQRLVFWICQTRGKRGSVHGHELKEHKLKFGVVAVGKCDILGGHTLLQQSTVEWRGNVKPELSNPMTTANCPGNEELDFRLIFGEDGQQQPLGPAGQWVSP